MLAAWARGRLDRISSSQIGCSVRPLLTSNEMESTPADGSQAIPHTPMEIIFQQATHFAISKLLEPQNVTGGDNGDLYDILFNAVFCHKDSTDAVFWKRIFEDTVGDERSTRLSTAQVQALEELCSRGRELAAEYMNARVREEDLASQRKVEEERRTGGTQTSPVAPGGVRAHLRSSSGGGLTTWSILDEQMTEVCLVSSSVTILLTYA